MKIKSNIYLKYIFLIGDWGLGIGDWGLGVWELGPFPNPQSPTPNPQPQLKILKKNKIFLTFLFI